VYYAHEAAVLEQEAYRSIDFAGVQENVRDIMVTEGISAARESISAAEGLNENERKQLNGMIDDYEDEVVAAEEEKLWDILTREGPEALTNEVIDRTQLPARGEHSKLSWSNTRDSWLKTRSDSEKKKSAQEEYNRKYSELLDYVESSEAMKSPRETIKKIELSGLEAGDESVLKGRLKERLEEKEESLRMKEIGEARRDIREGRITRANAGVIWNTERYKYLTGSDRTALENFIYSWESRQDEAKNPNEVTDSGALLEAVTMAMDPGKNIPETEKHIRDNTGADENGNPRLSVKDAPNLIKLARQLKEDYYLKAAGNRFENALADELIDDKQYVELTTQFIQKVATGEYTEDGIVQLAENMLVQASEDYAKQLFKETKGYRWRWSESKQEAERARYIAEHRPETIQAAPGSVEDFQLTYEKKPKETTYTSQGNEVQVVEYSGKDRYFSKIGGIWHFLNEDSLWQVYEGQFE